MPPPPASSTAQTQPEPPPGTPGVRLGGALATSGGMSVQLVQLGTQVGVALRLLIGLLPPLLVAGVVLVVVEKVA